jgi:hypothetical protein
MIRWILLLQEFDLQIIQRSEAQLEERGPIGKEALPCSMSIVFVPTGTLRYCEEEDPLFFAMVQANIFYPPSMDEVEE